MSRQQSGWTLVELAVSLAIAALLTGLLFTLLPLGRQVAEGDRQQRQLTQAEEALLGFSLAHYHLPPADTTGDGLSDAGATRGMLPVRTLGLPSGIRLQYEVDGTLAAPPSRHFVPYLPDAYASQLSAAPNGLDMCMLLLEQQRAGVSHGAMGMSAAYAVAAPNEAGHHSIEVSSTDIELPGSATAANRPTLAVAAGPGELATRMACPELLARAHGAAQGAMAAYSVSQAAAFNQQFRVFDQKIAQLVKSQAESGLALASVGLAMGIFDEIMAVILTAAGWPPSGFSIAVGIGEHVTAATSIGLSIASVVWATDDLKNARTGIDNAKKILDLVNTNKARADRLYQDSAKAALNLEKGGLKR